MSHGVEQVNSSTAVKPAKDLSGDPILDQNNTIGAAAEAFLVSSLNDLSTHVFWSVSVEDITVTFDGSDPVASTNGHIIASGASGIWSREMAEACRAISAGGGAIVHISELQTL